MVVLILQKYQQQLQYHAGGLDVPAGPDSESCITSYKESIWLPWPPNQLLCFLLLQHPPAQAWLRPTTPKQRLLQHLVELSKLQLHAAQPSQPSQARPLCHLRFVGVIGEHAAALSMPSMRGCWTDHHQEQRVPGLHPLAAGRGLMHADGSWRTTGSAVTHHTPENTMLCKLAGCVCSVPPALLL